VKFKINIVLIKIIKITKIEIKIIHKIIHNFNNIKIHKLNKKIINNNSRNKIYLKKVQIINNN
jgi:hypothetical protein